MGAARPAHADGAFKVDLGRFQGDAGAVDGDFAARPFDLERLACHQFMHLAGVGGDGGADIEFEFAVDLSFVVAADDFEVIGVDVLFEDVADGVQVVFAVAFLLVAVYFVVDVVADGVAGVVADAFGVVVADGDGFVVADAFRLVVADAFASIVADGVAFVVFDDGVVVFLGVHEDFFAVFFVLKPQFIISGAFMGSGFDGHAGLMLRQAIRRRVGGVVGPSGDDGLIRVAF